MTLDPVLPLSGITGPRSSAAADDVPDAMAPLSEYVTSVAGASSLGAATSSLIETGCRRHGWSRCAATPTTITRVSMVSFYMTSTMSRDPSSCGRVNYPNLPIATTTIEPATTIADGLEDLSFSYDVVTAAPTSCGAVGPGMLRSRFPIRRLTFGP